MFPAMSFMKFCLCWVAFRQGNKETSEAKRVIDVETANYAGNLGLTHKICGAGIGYCQIVFVSDQLIVE